MQSEQAIFAAFHRPPADFERAHNVLESMDATDRRLIELHLVDGAECPELAEATGLSLNNVRVRLFRVLKTVQGELSRGMIEV